VGAAVLTASGLAEQTLATGDAARCTDAGELELVAGSAGGEVLVWLTT